MSVEIFLAIFIPGIGAAAAIVKYFWKKEKCFLAMKTKINSLSKSDKNSIEVHDDIEDRLNGFESRQSKNEIYLKLLLDKFEIKYDA